MNGRFGKYGSSTNNHCVALDTNYSCGHHNSPDKNIDVVIYMNKLKHIVLILFLSSCSWGTTCVFASPVHQCGVIEVPEILP